MVLYTYTMQETMQTVTAAGPQNWRRQCGFPARQSPSFASRELRIRRSMASVQTSECVHGKGFVV